MERRPEFTISSREYIFYLVSRTSRFLYTNVSLEIIQGGE